MDNDAYSKNNVPEKGAKPGVYVHPGSDETLEVTEFTQADALVRQGWVWKSQLDPADVRAKRAAERQREADNAAGVVTASNNALDKKGNK